MNFNPSTLEQLAHTNPLAYGFSILPAVSRTFALGIEALSGPLKNGVMVGYLLCRIIDTIEDDASLSPKQKCAYFETFIECFDDPSKIVEMAQASAQLTGDPAHVFLVKHTSAVFHIFQTLTPNTQNALKTWVFEMAQGMMFFVNRDGNALRIQSFEDYQTYCYYVAGTVGFMLTELWKEYGCNMDGQIYETLLAKASAFGAGLQTINILKDVVWDKEQENAIYVPLEMLAELGCDHTTMWDPENREKSQAVLQKMLDFAQTSLTASIDYVKAIPKRNLRIRFFCVFPLLLAFATLRELKRAPTLLTPERKIKVTRQEVKRIKRQSMLIALSNRMLDRILKQVFP